MTAILEAIAAGQLDARVSLVLSNNPDAPALQVAQARGIATITVPSKGKTREEHETEVLAALSKYEVDFIVLAGYMRVLTPFFLRAFKHAGGYFRVINIHPSYLPNFPGANAYEDAFNAGVKESGITVHLVDEQVDHGPILAQEKFQRMDDDSLESFKARGLAIEHQLYPKVLQKIAKEGIQLRAPTASAEAK